MIKAFIDFDGTITTVDVGDTMFETFGGTASVESIAEYRNGKISAVECFRRECSACGSVDKNRLDMFLDNQPIDATITEFFGFCTTHNIECTVLSDGMDYYIERILRHNGLQHVRYYANHLDLKPMDGSGTVLLQPSFPYTDETCDRCACCKRNHILTNTADDDVIIYVGEGYSDRCPVRYADIVFAKDELLNYCRAENISYFEYTSFRDVVDRLALMIDSSSTKKKSSLHKRRQAQLACREVYLAG